jgi:hypothetical protein
MASKLSGIAMRNQSLDSGTKLTVASIIGGLASKASGGDFYQGAINAMFVYLYNDSYEDPRLKAAGVPSAMRQSGYGTKDNSIKLLKTLEATNDKRKLGAVSLVYSKDNTVSMVRVGGEVPIKALEGIAVGAGARIGALNFYKPMTYNSTNKSFTIVNAGFNTFSGNIGLVVSNLKVDIFGYAAGASINCSLGKSGFIGASFGIGFGVKWSWE